MLIPVGLHRLYKPHIVHIISTFHDANFLRSILLPRDCRETLMRYICLRTLNSTFLCRLSFDYFMHRRQNKNVFTLSGRLWCWQSSSVLQYDTLRSSMKREPWNRYMYRFPGANSGKPRRTIPRLGWKVIRLWLVIICAKRWCCHLWGRSVKIWSAWFSRLLTSAHACTIAHEISQGPCVRTYTLCVLCIVHCVRRYGICACLFVSCVCMYLLMYL